MRLGLPVLVATPGPARRFALWCRRHPGAAALAILAPLALAAGLAFLSFKNREIELSAKELEAKEKHADAATALATARFVDFQRLDDLRTVQVLEQRERDLWPPHPAMAEAMERWIADARALLARLPEHRAALAALRRRGRSTDFRPPGADAAADDIRNLSRFRDAARSSLDAPGLGEPRLASLRTFVSEADAEIADLEKELASRPVFEFDDVRDQSIEDNLGRLVERLDALEGSSKIDGTVASVEHRLETARDDRGPLARRGVRRLEGGGRSHRQSRARTRPTRGSGSRPSSGLVPIGRDPRSKLWEFAHLLSGTPPARDPAGNLVLSDQSSIVLVLIPGGTLHHGRARPGRRRGARGQRRPARARRRSAGPRRHARSLPHLQVRDDAGAVAAPRPA